MLVGLLRYAHLLERLGPSLLNTLGLAAGWVCAAGLTMVGNFQVRGLQGAPGRGGGLAVWASGRWSVSGTPRGVRTRNFGSGLSRPVWLNR